jgi:hypothetical protein
MGRGMERVMFPLNVPDGKCVGEGGDGKCVGGGG